MVEKDDIAKKVIFGEFKGSAVVKLRADGVNPTT